MHDYLRWLAPAAAVALSQHCYAVQYLTVAQAQQLMFSEAKEFAPTPLKLSREQVKEIERLSGVEVRTSEQPVWVARADGKAIGWFIIDEVYGKHELITYAVALNPDASVRQIEVLEYRETYGYEIRNPNWRRQFVGKRHSDPLTLTQDIKNITGATLSCRHVTEGVKRLLATQQVALR